MSNTLYTDGISRSEWDITLGGDGFWQAVDPYDHNIVYSEYQYGNIFRYDKLSGEKLSIKPRESKDDSLFKWNWNAPFILSNHNNKRLYMVANYVFQSDDRGQSWKKISNDITAKVNRNNWKVMGRYWGIDGVAKDVSTSLYGTGVSLAESPIKEGLIFVGTDDGVLSISNNGGTSWTKINSFPGVPSYTYISDIEPSNFDTNTVYITLDNRKHFDFTPYVLKSTDLGKSWVSISGNIPSKHPIHTFKEDHKDVNLLFVGTEFGLFFSSNGGKNWQQLKSELPTIAVRDIAVQKDEDDLVIATFGRGFYVLDDYSPLRELQDDLRKTNFTMFPIKDARFYVKRSRGGYGFGSVDLKDENEKFGALFTYYINETPKTFKEIRREKEKELIKNNLEIPYPSFDDLRKENEEIAPYLKFIIKDYEGKPIRSLTKNINHGINRVYWDLRYFLPKPLKLNTAKFEPLTSGNSGFLAIPGDYKLDVFIYSKSTIDTVLLDKVFKVSSIELLRTNKESGLDNMEFYKKIVEIYKITSSVYSDINELNLRLKNIKQQANNTPGISEIIISQIKELESKLSDMKWQFEGYKSKASSEEKLVQPVPINDRLNMLLYTHFNNTFPVTKAEKETYNILKEIIPNLKNDIEDIKEIKFKILEKNLSDIGAGWVPIK